MPTHPTHLDVLAIGRSGVDIYPLQAGVGLEMVDCFGKFLGGSPTNVAVAAARMGRRSAIITAVGDDPFGRFVRAEMRRLGVSDHYVRVIEGITTPVTFCEIFPPDNFPLYFYRDPTAPDLQLQATHIPLDAVRSARVFWFSASGLCAEPVRSAHHAALQARALFDSREIDNPYLTSPEWTILDLDYRPRFWRSEEHAREEIEAVLPYVNVAIGNLQECAIAVGYNEAERAADALLERGVEIAVIKQGLKGTLAKTREERIFVPATRVKTLNGLGAGDSFGGSFCHALLQGWDLGRVVHFASTAGAIVASRLECSTAMPTEFEVDHLINANPDIFPRVERLTLTSPIPPSRPSASASPMTTANAHHEVGSYQ